MSGTIKRLYYITSKGIANTPMYFNGWCLTSEYSERVEYESLNLVEMMINSLLRKHACEVVEVVYQEVSRSVVPINSP